MTELSIIVAGPEHAELIADLSRQTFFDTFAPSNTKEDMDLFMEVQFTKKALIEEVGADGNIFLLAFREGEPVGYVRMRESASPEQLGSLPAIEIARIYTVQKTIGKGVGSALMEKCLEIANAKHKQLIWLGVWENNTRAIDFYTRWGFTKFGEHPFILGTDMQTDWMMVKHLNGKQA
jgi:diamine N-acetyltransferase